ncbi:MAG: hypothetical protein ABI760_11450 [Ferruginibacter sp.]
MAALKFAFNQEQINKLINNAPASENIMVSMLSAKNNITSKNSLFLAAQSGNPVSNAPNKQIAPAVGCPVPPGWSAQAAAIGHDQLDGKTKFIIPASAKQRLLANNTSDGDLSASLDVNALSFKIKNGIKSIGTIVGEVL